MLKFVSCKSDLAKQTQRKQELRFNFKFRGKTLKREFMNKYISVNWYYGKTQQCQHDVVNDN